MGLPAAIGPYTVVRELGRGGMGVVYEVRHPRAARPLALKQLLEHDTSPTAEERFAREVVALARVRHPNVVTLLAHDRSPEGPYLVTELVEGTRAREAYGEPVVRERHRHRYEVNNAYREALVDAGLVVSGTFQEGRLVEIVELPEHPWFVASQFHPEFRSRPTRPAPLFREFVAAALERAHARAGVAARAG